MPLYPMTSSNNAVKYLPVLMDLIMDLKEPDGAGFQWNSLDKNKDQNSILVFIFNHLWHSLEYHRQKTWSGRRASNYSLNLLKYKRLPHSLTWE